MSNEQSQKDKKNLYKFKGRFGERLRIVRGNRSRETFAQMLSVSSSAINNYENEVRSPTVDFLYLLYIHEGVMPNWIMLGCGNIYEEDCPREELIPELYHERSIVNKIIEGLHLESEITSKQRDAIVEIIKEELKKKVTAIVQAITG